MRIAITVDPYLPVPPQLYGGIERVVDFLVRGLSARGHQVTLYAHPESRTDARLVAYGAPPHFGWRPRLTELWQVSSSLMRDWREFELVHSFGRLAALFPLLPLRSLPKIQSYQRDYIPWQSVKSAVRLAGDSILFTACSASVFRERPQQGRHGGDWQAIFNGVDLEKYHFMAQVPPDAPLVFLGRLEPIKGVHHAIAVAKAAGRRLIIAGNRVESGSAAGYFAAQIQPHLSGAQISYIGAVDDQQKNALLGAAAALLMPIEWEEPFGIVMAEALACGTPVLGFHRGSVPEVVREGISGFISKTTDEMAAQVKRLPEIERTKCRMEAERRFSNQVIVGNYEELYQHVLAHQ